MIRGQLGSLDALSIIEIPWLPQNTQASPPKANTIWSITFLSSRYGYTHGPTHITRWPYGMVENCTYMLSMSPAYCCDVSNVSVDNSLVRNFRYPIEFTEFTTHA